MKRECDYVGLKWALRQGPEDRSQSGVQGLGFWGSGFGVQGLGLFLGSIRETP